jgi:hypothetical protein
LMVTEYFGPLAFAGPVVAGTTVAGADAAEAPTWSAAARGSRDRAAETAISRRSTR